MKENNKNLEESAKIERAAEDEIKAVKVRACETKRELRRKRLLQKSCDKEEFPAKELHDLNEEKNSFCQVKPKKTGFWRKLFKKLFQRYSRT